MLSEADRQRLRSALNELAQSDPLDDGNRTNVSVEQSLS